MTLGSALIVATCSARDRAAPPAASPLDALARATASASAESAAPPMPTEVPVALAPSAAPDVAPSAAPAAGAGSELDDFYAALRGLESHARHEHVRLAWLGDSHGASDLWSGPLREALQTRFGDGGPGFVHLGYKSYRHDGIRPEVRGRWAVSPRGPATGVRTGDGVFGLGGVLLAGSDDGPRAGLTVTDPGAAAALSWDVCYKLGSPRDAFQLSLTGLPDRVVKCQADEPLGALRHLVLHSTVATPTLRALPLGGQPGFCGVVIESSAKTAPGVVLDTLGINGARLTTPLAWNEAAWIAELKRRPPALVILEYGTNESGDHSVKPASYVENVRRVMARVHAASPGCDCVVLAPTDRADTPETTPLVRDALREAARASNCMFWDTYTVMGGKGSILAWRAESPPRAGPDGVHLAARGYRELGQRLAADLMAGYRP